jgi:hypothetical protein
MHSILERNHSGLMRLAKQPPEMRMLRQTLLLSQKRNVRAPATGRANGLVGEMMMTTGKKDSKWKDYAKNQINAG